MGSEENIWGGCGCDAGACLEVDYGAVAGSARVQWEAFCVSYYEDLAGSKSPLIKDRYYPSYYPNHKSGITFGITFGITQHAGLCDHMMFHRYVQHTMQDEFLTRESE